MISCMEMPKPSRRGQADQEELGIRILCLFDGGSDEFGGDGIDGSFDLDLQDLGLQNGCREEQKQTQRPLHQTSDLISPG